MAPAIYDGDLLLVEAADPTSLRYGDVVLFRHGDAFRAHRLVSVNIEEGVFVTRGDASDQNDLPIVAGDIAGKVTAVEKNKSKPGCYKRLLGESPRFQRTIRRTLKSIRWLFREPVSKAKYPMREAGFIGRRPTATRFAWLVLLALLCTTSILRAQVAVSGAVFTSDDITRNPNGTGQTVTTPAITPGGTNRLLVVGVSMNIAPLATAVVTGVTFGATALTRVTALNDAANDRRVEIWTLANPAAASNTISAVFTRPGTTAITYGVTVGAIALNGVDQTAPVRTIVSASGANTSTIAQLNVASNPGDMVIDTLAIGTARTVANPGGFGNSQTPEWALASPGGGGGNIEVFGTGSTRTGAPNVPLSESFSGASSYAVVAISVQPMQADLSVTDSGNSVAYPANVTYTLTVKNNGPTTATGITLTDTLAAGLTLVSVTPSTGSCTTGPISCNLGTLASGATATVTVVATPSASGGYANTASVSGTVTDLDSGNNSATGVAYAQLNACSTVTATAGGTLTGIINTYYPGAATAATGSTSISLGAATGATGSPIAAGDLLLVIQMQDAAISSNNDITYGDGATGSGATSLNNSGLYEFVTATNAVPATGGTLNLSGAGPGGGLLFTYTAAAATGTQGQRAFQVVRVPHFASATLGAGLTASAWNGSSGGVFALDVVNALTLNGQTVDVSGLGFRGGAGLELNGGVAGSTTNDYRQVSPTTYPTPPTVGSVPVAGIDGPKGEGIAGTPRWVQFANTPLSTGVEGYPNGSMGRGAPGNAGGGGTDANTGNDQNAGGGGGANGGFGGLGGDAWDTNLSTGGLGGTSFPAGIGRIIMGGGGGGGSRNNSDNNTAGAPTRIAQASSGSAGGGIVIIRAGTVTGTATINANGADAYDLTSNDAGGGGGAGGTVIMVSAAGTLGTLTVNAHGGSGGDAWDDDANAGPPLADRHGPGGGGGGGVVFLSGAATVNVAAGTHGTTLPAPGQYQYGATDGTAGTSATSATYFNAIPGPHSITPCIDVSITKSDSPDPVVQGNTLTYTLVVKNNSATSATGVTVTDPLPGAITYVSATSSPAGTCSQSAGTVTCSLGTLTGGSTDTITITTTAVTPSTITNTATVTQNEADFLLSNNTASATTTISPSANLSITKTAPASVITGTNFNYVLTVTDNGPSGSTNVVVTDTLPAGVTFVSSTTTQGTCSGSATVTCNIGSLNVAPAAGSSATVTITVKAGAAGKVTNTGNVSGTESDPNTANNTASATTVITFPTSVNLRTFTATSRTGGVLLVWRTGGEQHNLGFNVYREQGGQRVRLNPSLIAGSALMFKGALPQHGGKSYAWIDRSVASSSTWYWLEDVDVDGTRTLHGPVSPSASSSGSVGAVMTTAKINSLAVTQTASSAVQAQTLSEMDAASNSGVNTAVSRNMQAVAQVASPASGANAVQYQLAAGPAVKILVTHEGWYQVTEPQLVAAGLSPFVDASKLQLFAEGVEQPIRITGTTSGGRGFGTQAAIEFYGTGIDTPYSDARVYWLVVGDRPGMRIGTVSAGGHAGTQPQAFADTIELKQRTTYFAALLRAGTDNYFGALVSTDPVDQILTANDVAPNGSVSLQIVLQGVIDGASHDVEVSFNGTTLGDLQFSGQNEGELDLDVPLNLVQQGENKVTLTAQDGDNDLSLVDYIRLTYPHTYTAESDALKFTAPPGSHVLVNGFTQPPAVLLDITDPGSPVALTGKASKQNGTYVLDVQIPWIGSGPRTFLTLADDQTSTPDQLFANHPSSWHSRQAGAQLIMISPSEFSSAMQPLAQLHQREGISVASVSVEDLYDEFNFGERSPYAIRQFLQTASTLWRTKPTDLLLVGDASIDPRNYLGFGFFDFVPTGTITTAQLKTASDDWFSDFNNTGIAQIPTGRLPVRSTTDESLVISKIASYENGQSSGPWAKQALLIADPDDDSGTFTQEAQTIQSLLPSWVQSTDVLVGTLDPSVAQQEVLDGINNGALLVNYNGHGSVEVWSGADLMDDTIASSLMNGGRLPVFIMMNCLNGFFNDVYTESLAEALLLSPNGGAVAAWASSGLTAADPQFAMDQIAVKTLFSSPSMTLGDAFQLAKQGTTDQDARRTFILFGDPLMRLNRAGVSSSSSGGSFRWQVPVRPSRR